jgi:hypothetical protein
MRDIFQSHPEALRPDYGGKKWWIPFEGFLRWHRPQFDALGQKRGSEGHRRPFQAKISDTTPPCKRPTLKAAASGTSLALALRDILWSKLCFYFNPWKDFSTRPDPAHRILSKTSWMRENRSDQSPTSITFRPRKMQSCKEVICCGLWATCLETICTDATNITNFPWWKKPSSSFFPLFCRSSAPLTTSNVLAARHLVFREPRHSAFSCHAL